MVSNWSHLNLRRHNFDFHLSNFVLAVDLFVVVAVVVVAAAAAVVALLSLMLLKTYKRSRKF